MRQMPAGSVDFICTDPPYLVGYTSRDGRSIANDRTDEWLLPAVMQMYRVLKYNRFAVSFYGWSALHQQHDTKEYEHELKFTRSAGILLYTPAYPCQ
jgi:adenine-specific DNA-methyltransferase